MGSQSEKLYQRQLNKEVLIDKSLKKLTHMLRKATDWYWSKEGNCKSDQLLKVLHIIGYHKNISFREPAVSAMDQSGCYDMDDIAQASQIRYRRIKLTGKWYKEDCGPLLGFIKGKNEPVALIPKGPTAYQMIDGDGNQICVINESLAKQLEVSAFIFYRPFPIKQIQVTDILKYSFESTWKQDFLKLIISSVIGGIIAMMIPIYAGNLFDSIVPDGDLFGVYQLTAMVMAIVLSGAMIQITKAIALTRIESSMESQLQAAIWDRLLSLPATFFKRFQSGDLANRAMGISEIRRVLSGVVINSIIAAFFSVFNLALLFYYSIELGFVSLCLIWVFISITGVLGIKQLKYEQKLVKLNSKNSGLLYELLSGMVKFKVAGMEQQAFGMWVDGFRQETESRLRRAKISNLSVAFASFFSLISYVILYYYMVQHFRGQMTTGIFVAFISAFGAFQMSMLALTKGLLEGGKVIPLYENAKPILDELPEYHNPKKRPEQISGDIDIRHVAFRYSPKLSLVLDDVSIKIKAGEYVALVGASGSGKSTLFRLLLGFEKPEKGKIYYGNQDLEMVNNRDIRKQLGVVLQNGQLMAGSLYTNIIGSNLKLTLDDAWRAAKLAGIDEDIKAMPMGMNTVISEGVSTISGGQKQRILIARAIVNQPKILYFDEATSALDNKTQELVAESLNGLTTTRVVIAHRLSTIKKCDRIYVMKDGKIVESGSYDELMSMKGQFFEIAKRQVT